MKSFLLFKIEMDIFQRWYLWVRQVSELWWKDGGLQGGQGGLELGCDQP